MTCAGRGHRVGAGPRFSLRHGSTAASSLRSTVSHLVCILSLRVEFMKHAAGTAGAAAVRFAVVASTRHGTHRSRSAASSPRPAPPPPAKLNLLDPRALRAPTAKRRPPRIVPTTGPQRRCAEERRNMQATGRWYVTSSRRTACPKRPAARLHSCPLLPRAPSRASHLVPASRHG